MTEDRLKHEITAGEDTERKFKRRFERAESMAAELVAMSNSGGGDIFVGVDDDGTIVGLTSDEVRGFNQQLSNAASQLVRPPIHPRTKNVVTNSGIVVVVHVENGINKPYVDRQGRVWIRDGADKRHVTAREELQRMFQKSVLIEADRLPLMATTLADVDKQAFSQYVGKFFSFLQNDGLTDQHLLENMGFIREGHLTIAGSLFFSRHTAFDLPSLSVRAIVFPGLLLSDTEYLDSEVIEGTLQQQYRGTMKFLARNLKKLQGEASFNSLGTWEVSETVLEELVINALVHRDLLIHAPVRLFVFRDRIEIISPGALPEHQTLAKVKTGATLRRNPVLAQHAERLLPYRGVGSGILRVLQVEPEVKFENCVATEEFKVIVPRKEMSKENGLGGCPTVPQILPKHLSSQPKASVPNKVKQLLACLNGEMSRIELQKAVGVASRSTFNALYLRVAIEGGYVERTLPGSPTSIKQKYRLTEKGRSVVEAGDLTDESQ